MEKINEVLASNVRRLRKKRGWTQEMLSEKAHLSMATIQNVELGNRWVGLDTIQALANALDVQESRLFADPEGESAHIKKLLGAIEFNLTEAQGGFSDIIRKLTETKPQLQEQTPELGDLSPVKRQFIDEILASLNDSEVSDLLAKQRLLREAKASQSVVKRNQKRS